MLPMDFPPAIHIIDHTQQVVNDAAHLDVKPKPKPVKPSTLPAWMVRFRQCVISHESLSAGLYKAQNPTSSASGAYQFIDSTWRVWMKRAGFSGYSRAMYAPPWVQDAVFYFGLAHGGGGAWAGDGCGHGS